MKILLPLIALLSLQFIFPTMGLASCGTTVTTFPYYESFEDYTGDYGASGWYTGPEMDSSFGAWELYTGSYFGITMHGENMIVLETSNQDLTLDGKAWFYSPCYDLSAKVGAKMTFQYYITSNTVFQLELSTDGGQNWSMVWNGANATTNNLQNVEVGLDTYVGNTIQLRFYADYEPVNFLQDKIFLDNVRVEATETFSTGDCAMIDSLPYSNSFENDWGGFSNHSSNQENWSMTNNGSLAFDGSYYIVKNADLFPSMLESPCFEMDTIGSISLAFKFLMPQEVNQAFKVFIRSANSSAWVSVFERTGLQSNTWQSGIIDLDAYVGQTIQLRFWHESNAASLRLDAISFFNAASSNYIIIPPADTNSIWSVAGNTVYLMDESVGVGTDQPGEYSFAVNGNVKTKEVNISVSDWPDYVFGEEYQLPDLLELASFIKTNGHLPKIPKEDEVFKEGVFIGEMNVKLLEKIEELTLYILEQEEKIKKLEEALEAIEKNSKKQEK